MIGCKTRLTILDSNVVSEQRRIWIFPVAVSAKKLLMNVVDEGAQLVAFGTMTMVHVAQGQNEIIESLDVAIAGRLMLHDAGILNTAELSRRKE